MSLGLEFLRIRRDSKPRLVPYDLMVELVGECGGIFEPSTIGEFGDFSDRMEIGVFDELAPFNSPEIDCFLLPPCLKLTLFCGITTSLALVGPVEVDVCREVLRLTVLSPIDFPAH